MKPGSANAKQEFVVVCYDVPENRRRWRLSRLLEGFGVRVQRSVFECWLTAGERRRLEKRIAWLANAAEDRVALHVLRQGAESRVVSLEGGGPARPAPFHVVG
jgi:CRISPR-associated protein Cas2